MINISIFIISILSIMLVIYLIYSKYNSKWPFKKDNTSNSSNSNKGIKLWTEFDTIVDQWTFLILQPSSNINIGFVPPSSDGTFDIVKESYVFAKKLNCFRNYNKISGVFALTNVILDTNPIPGNILPFDVYTYNKTNKKVQHYIISRPTKLIKATSSERIYSVDNIIISGDDTTNIQQIQGNFVSNIPSKIIFN